MTTHNNLILFFDGCHKIYYATRSDMTTIDQMKEWSYKVIDGDFSENIDYLWANSCCLRFVEPADLDPCKPCVTQFQKGGLKGFRTKLHNYYKNHVQLA